MSNNNMLSIAGIAIFAAICALGVSNATNVNAQSLKDLNTRTVQNDDFIAFFVEKPNSTGLPEGPVVVPDINNDSGIIVANETDVIIVPANGSAPIEIENGTVVQPAEDNNTAVVSGPETNVTETPGGVIVVETPEPPCGCPTANETATESGEKTVTVIPDEGVRIIEQNATVSQPEPEPQPAPAPEPQPAPAPVEPEPQAPGNDTGIVVTPGNETGITGGNETVEGPGVNNTNLTTGGTVTPGAFTNAIIPGIL
jgi:hypothetical protein